MAEQICPPLPAASVDMNALHAAARQNHDLGKALADATAPDVQPEETAPPPADEADQAPPPADAGEEQPAAAKRGK